MAEEQFTSRRARREAERLKAEQAFEVRDTPEQSSDETAALRAQLLTPAPGAPSEPAAPSAQPKEKAGEVDDDTDRAPIDAEPAPQVSHERGPLATDHPLEERPPVNAEDRLDPQRTPLPHFESRAARKRYLREHGLSLDGDLSTGAMPVIAEPEDAGSEDTGPEDGGAKIPTDDSAKTPPAAGTEPGASAAKPEAVTAKSESVTEKRSAPTRPQAADDSAPSGEPEYVPARNAEPESYDTAGFGGAAEEVAARDFESPVTADSGPRPVSPENEPYDALSKPLSALESDDGDVPSLTTAEITGTGVAEATDSRAVEETAATTPASPNAAPKPSTEKPSAEKPSTDKPSAEKPGAEKSKARSKGSKARWKAPKTEATAPGSSTAETGTTKAASGETEGRSRRMPIVQPPSTSGVRVVTASSAQIPEAAEDRSSTESASAAGTGTTGTGVNQDQEAGTPANQASGPADSTAAEASPDDAARALAANPETRPMDTVPEAWSLPNANYEDEETENPPAERIRASAVTGHDGRILVGEEPSKVPFIALGVAATVAVALIVIALVMLL
ncbi:hypothetical protein ACH82I_02630 [Brevibacterium sp. GP-SGM9]|uniref:hypothetical protein n=1 Tax=Brevibacterium sp. GP-SGM9 TaxID=3376990 RepID=UPI0039A724D9